MLATAWRVPACAKVARALQRRVKCDAATWYTAVDAASGRTYYYTADGAVQWEPPAGENAQPRTRGDGAPVATQAQPGGAQLSFEALEELLSATPGAYLSSVVEPHRATAFSDAFTEWLTARVDGAADKADSERYDKLRARLANPLIRQPPPF